MVQLAKMLFGGGGGSSAAPKQDAQLSDLQKKQADQEQARADDLAAQEAAQKRALDSGRVGRSLLTYTPVASKGSDSLGGG